MIGKRKWLKIGGKGHSRALFHLLHQKMLFSCPQTDQTKGLTLAAGLSADKQLTGHKPSNASPESVFMLILVCALAFPLQVATHTVGGCWSCERKSSFKWFLWLEIRTSRSFFMCTRVAKGNPIPELDSAAQRSWN